MTNDDTAPAPAPDPETLGDAQEIPPTPPTAPGRLVGLDGRRATGEAATAPGASRRGILRTPDGRPFSDRPHGPIAYLADDPLA